MTTTTRLAAVFFAFSASLLAALWLVPAKELQVVPLESTAEASAAVSPPADGKPVVTIDRNAKLGKIDDFVYGVNAHLDDAKHSTKLTFPIARWGGNATTRHNWKANTTNRAADWFFMNIQDGTFPHDGKDVGLADHVVLTVKAQGELLYTLPTIGWTPKDKETRWGFSVEKYGPQQRVEDWHPDAGNGVRRDGKMITNNDAKDTSMRIGPEWVTEWMAHVKDLLGGRGARDGGVRYYALDNEPDLWHQTHRDVREGDDQLKTPYLTYDELWDRTVAYASAIKKADPAAQVTGPVMGVWCDYFGSPLDVNDNDGDCKTGKDREAHGGQPIIKWYLQKICETQARTGVRLVDYLDVHYYPENLDMRSEDPAVGRDRLQRVRAFYDPSFADPSWIGEPVRLIPRMKEWIAAACPGTKLALTEWRFGWDDGLTTALAQAESLAVFGREGVDMATTWGPIPAGSLLEAAYRLYLDYDGNGASALGGTSVRASVAGAMPATLTAYAIAKGSKTLVYVFNKDETKTLTPRVVLAGAESAAPKAVYRFGKDGLVPATSLDIAPWSAILAVFEP